MISANLGFPTDSWGEPSLCRRQKRKQPFFHLYLIMLGMVPGIDNKKKIFKMKDDVLGSRNKIQYQQDTQD